MAVWLWLLRRLEGQVFAKWWQPSRSGNLVLCIVLTDLHWSLGIPLRLKCGFKCWISMGLSLPVSSLWFSSFRLRSLPNGFSKESKGFAVSSSDSYCVCKRRFTSLIRIWIGSYFALTVSIPESCSSQSQLILPRSIQTWICPGYSANR